MAVSALHSPYLHNVSLGDGIAVAELKGDIDILARASLVPVFELLTAPTGMHLVLDLRRVAFADTVLLTLLYGAAARLRVHHGDLDLVAPTRRVRRLFTAARLEDHFRFHDSVAAALAFPAQVRRMPV